MCSRQRGTKKPFTSAEIKSRLLKMKNSMLYVAKQEIKSQKRLDFRDKRYSNNWFKARNWTQTLHC